MKFLREIAIYTPMIYTAPCILFWMRAYPSRGQVGGGWALEIESFLGPGKWHRADRREPFPVETSWLHPASPAGYYMQRLCMSQRSKSNRE